MSPEMELIAICTAWLATTVTAERWLISSTRRALPDDPGERAAALTRLRKHCRWIAGGATLSAWALLQFGVSGVPDLPCDEGCEVAAPGGRD